MDKETTKKTGIMENENETLRTLMATPLGGIAHLADTVVEVRKAEKVSLCRSCVFSTKKKGFNAWECPYHRACMSPFRPDRESVVFGKL